MTTEVSSWNKFHFNIFVSQRLYFEKKIELFCLENASKLTLEVFYGIFNKKILMHFLEKMVHLFFLKIVALRSESVKVSLQRCTVLDDL